MVIPVSLQSEILKKLHVGQGIRKCRERAKQAVWWPGISKQLEKLVSECPKCINFGVQRAEPLIPSPLPSLLWQMIGTDLFHWEKDTYLRDTSKSGPWTVDWTMDWTRDDHYQLYWDLHDYTGWRTELARSQDSGNSCFLWCVSTAVQLTAVSRAL